MDPKKIITMSFPAFGVSASVTPGPAPHPGTVSGVMTLSGTGAMSIDGTVQDASSGYFLDSYSPWAAYSFRQLGTLGTAAVQLRRLSDGSTADFGWDGSGNFDAAGAATWIGASTGNIRIWYDQSGNSRNLLQASQPAMPVYGTTYFSGDDAGMQLQTVDSLPLSAQKLFGTTWTVLMTIGDNPPANNAYFMYYDNVEYLNTTTDDLIFATNFMSDFDNNNMFATAGPHIFSLYIGQGGSAGIYGLKSTAGTQDGTLTFSGTTDVYFIRLGANVTHGNWNCNEFIMFDSNEGTAIDDMTDNMNAYWGYYS